MLTDGMTQVSRGVNYVIEDMVCGHPTPRRRWAAAGVLALLLVSNYRSAKRHCDTARQRELELELAA